MTNKMLEEDQRDQDELKEKFPFNPDDSYYPFTENMQIVPAKPDCIPALDFKDLPEYETSDDEAEP